MAFLLLGPGDGGYGPLSLLMNQGMASQWASEAS